MAPPVSTAPRFAATWWKPLWRLTGGVNRRTSGGVNGAPYRFLRRGTAYGLAGLLIALASSVQAGESGGETVIFSDRGDNVPSARVRDPRQNRSKRSWGWENPLEHIGRGSRGSLDAVTAPPFAPVVPPAETYVPLTDKELRQLRERRHWIQRRPEDLDRPNTDPRAILGVRKTDSPGTREGTGQSGKGWLAEYYERAGESRQTETDRDNNRLTSERSSGRSPSEQDAWLGGPEDRRDLGTPPSLQPADTFWGPDWEKRVGEGFRPEALDPFETRQEYLRSSYAGPTWLRTPPRRERQRPSLPAFLQPGGPNNAAGTSGTAEPLQGIARILGGNPISSPFNNSPVTSLDPVMAYPDPTREAMNPVTPVNYRAEGIRLPGMADANIQAPGRDRMLTRSASAPTLAAPNAVLPSPAQGLNNTPDQRRPLHSIKVNIEMPRRSF